MAQSYPKIHDPYTKIDETMPHPNTNLPPTLGPASRIYQRHLQEGYLQPDTDQSALLPLMDQLVVALATPVQRMVWRKVEVWRTLDGSPPPKGLYMSGPVGRGKSILMQMVFDATPMEEKRRVHFHPFMEELQQRMHTAQPPEGVDMVLKMASEISATARLLCFDEFYVTNIGDAILLGRLLEAFFQCGVTLCTTSNWAPRHLFQDGYNRLSFLPFLDILTQNTTLTAMPQGTDWRRNAGKQETAPDANTQFTLWTNTQATPGVVPFSQVSVQALGRVERVYWFDFQELCARVIGRMEYMELCTMAQAVIISDLPPLGLTEHAVDAAMRFVVLIDLLYEYNIPTRIFSHGEVDDLCPAGPAAFAFQRTLSRIYSLQRLEHVNPVVHVAKGKHG